MPDFKPFLMLTAFWAIFQGFSGIAKADPRVQAAPPVAVASESLGLPDPTGLVVVELFSSQACMFCPRADAYLNRLAKMDNVIPLSCHVDYFDVKEGSLAQSFCTKRQTDYSRTLRSGPKYTPQMVLNGKFDTVGYKEDKISSALFKAGTEDIPQIAVKPADTTTRFTLGLPDVAQGQYDIWVLITEQPLVRSVLVGKNRGQSIIYENIISEMSNAMKWDGKAQDVTLTAGLNANKKALVILAQNAQTGEIVAAGQLKRQTRPVATGND